MVASTRGHSGAARGRERLLALLVDPGEGSRAALTCIEKLGLARWIPAVARRVKAARIRPVLTARALACLERQGFEPGRVEPGVQARSRTPALDVSRQGQSALLPGRRGRPLMREVPRHAWGFPDRRGGRGRFAGGQLHLGAEGREHRRPRVESLAPEALEPERDGGARQVQPDRRDPRRRSSLGRNRPPRLSRDPRLDSRGLGRGRRVGRDQPHRLGGRARPGLRAGPRRPTATRKPPGRRSRSGPLRGIPTS